MRPGRTQKQEKWKYRWHRNRANKKVYQRNFHVCNFVEEKVEEMGFEHEFHRNVWIRTGRNAETPLCLRTSTAFGHIHSRVVWSGWISGFFCPLVLFVWAGLNTAVTLSWHRDPRQPLEDMAPVQSQIDSGAVCLWWENGFDLNLRQTIRF